MLILCEVAALARQIRAESTRALAVRRATSISQLGISRAAFDGLLRQSSHSDDGGSNSKGATSAPDDSSNHNGLIIDPCQGDHRQGVLDRSWKMKMNELLGAWYVVGSLLTQ